MGCSWPDRVVGLPLVGRWSVHKVALTRHTLLAMHRKRARVSGFRTRMATTAGRKVLAKRRLKGRKVLCPGGRPTRK